jgi:H+/Cl- antiporter ClcA
MGRWLIIAGLALVVVGTALHFAPWLLSWFGKLPGDIRIETERTRLYIPITSMVVVSVILTLLINLFKR